MANYEIGNLIRRLRIQKGLKQEELAFPILDQTTLSKIENGRVLPNKKTMEALFQRLGVNPANMAAFFLDKKLAKIQQLCDEIDSRLLLQKFDHTDAGIAELDALIHALENSLHADDNSLHRQYLLIAKACNAVNKRQPTAAIHAYLTEALHISLPHFDVAKLDSYYLTRADVKIINLQSILYHEEGDYEAAINLRYGLKHNIEKNCIDTDELGRSYPNIAYNLANSLYKTKRYSESLAACDDGIQTSLKTRALYFLPMMTFLKAINLLNLGETDAGKKLIPQAYYGMKMYGQDDQAKNVQVLADDFDIVL